MQLSDVRRCTVPLREPLVGLVWGLQLGLALAMAGAVCAASTSDSLDDAIGLLRSSEATADFLVLVDTSASMAGPKFAAVRRSLSALTAAMSPGDYISVIGFDRKPYLLVSPHRLESTNQNLLTEIRAIPEPTAMPRPGDAGASDLGQALRKLLEEMLRRNASDLQFVFLFTDGLHQPPRETDYPAGDPNPWSALRASAEEALRGGKAEVTWLWFDQGASRDSITLVFPEARPLVLTPGEMQSYFERFRDEVVVRRARLQLRGELAQGGVSFDPATLRVRVKYGQSARRDLVLRAAYARLPITATPGTPAEQPERYLAFSVNAAGKDAIGPGKTGKVGELEVRHLGGQPGRALLACLGTLVHSAAVTLSVPVTAQLEPRAGLQRLDPGVQTATKHDVRMSVQVDVLSPVPPALTWLVLLGIGILILYRRFAYSINLPQMPRLIIAIGVVVLLGLVAVMLVLHR